MERKGFSSCTHAFIDNACGYASCAKLCPGNPRAPPSLYRNADPPYRPVLDRVTGHDGRGHDNETFL